MSLQQKTLTGIVWSLFENFGSQGITGIVTIFLARILTPEDFGLIAMLTVFIQVANSLMNSGLSEALIQKKHSSETDYCTVFFLNLFFGISAYIILYLSAPKVAVFYNEERLIDLIRVIGISIIINSLRVIQETDLRKQLNFKPIVIATLPSAIISGVLAIILAYYDFGVWALVSQILAASLFTTLILFLNNGWSPQLKFSLNSFKELFGFGLNILLSRLIDIIFQNIFVIVIAKLFSAQEAGYYFFAQKIRQIVIFQITQAVQKVTFPALSTIQNNPEDLKNGFRKVMKSITFVLFPIIFLSIVLAEPAFNFFLNSEWLPAVPILQLLFFAGLLVPLHSVNLNILKVKGRSDLFLYLEIIKKSLVGIVLIISHKYGIHAIIYGQIFTSIIGYIPNGFFSNKLIGYSYKQQLSDICFSLFLSSLTAFFIYKISNYFYILPAILNIFLFTAIFFLIYLTLNYKFTIELVSTIFIKNSS